MGKLSQEDIEEVKSYQQLARIFATLAGFGMVGTTIEFSSYSSFYQGIPTYILAFNGNNDDASQMVKDSAGAMAATLEGVKLFSMLTIVCMVGAVTFWGWSHFMIVSRKKEKEKKVKE